MDARASTVLLAAFAAACAGAPAPPTSPPPETPAAHSRPEPDPACRGTVQASLARNALETVTVRLSLDPAGRVELVDVLFPALTPAARTELERAFSACAWAPRPAAGTTETFTTTWVREPVRR